MVASVTGGLEWIRIDSARSFSQIHVMLQPVTAPRANPIQIPKYDLGASHESGHEQPDTVICEVGAWRVSNKARGRLTCFSIVRALCIDTKRLEMTLAWRG
eukprot:6485847-Amphidinium_carterae.1